MAAMYWFELRFTPLAGLAVVQRRVREDSRGFFSRLYCTNELSAAGFALPVVQINHTRTLRRGAVRGLHFQRPPHAEDKFVSCLRGEVFDVAVDLRRDSPTYLRWHGEVLSAENRVSLMIPQGFAHGFQTLADDCELLYLHSRAYEPEAEGALHVNDPALAIAWPLPIAEMSERDARHVPITPEFRGI
jgi:dTDP-4-dehydrorhamnose 3,5-epimerase